METKNILKIFGIWSLVVFVIFNFFGLLMLFDTINGPIDLISIVVFNAIVPQIFIPFDAAIIFSPALIILFFLFKKFKNKETRLWLISFTIPLVFLIYWSIEHFCFNGLVNDFISIFIMGFSIFIIMPLIIITALFVPKSILPAKWDIISTSIITGVLTFIFAIIFAFTLPFLDKMIFTQYLNKYNPLIENLEKYKSQNGTYPKNVDDSIKAFENFSYELHNNGKDYKISVGNGYFTYYNYCSSEEIFGCKEGRYSYMEYKKFGNWIKAQDDD